MIFDTDAHGEENSETFAALQEREDAKESTQKKIPEENGPRFFDL
jgi:hypothetical protein